MSANKKNTNSKDSIELSGKVVMKPFGAGSKSEHKAICLQTDKGDYVLRRVGGNPFHDAELHKLVGKHITAIGNVADYIFFAKDINEDAP